MQERDIFDQLFYWLGIDGGSALSLILLTSLVSNFLYRLIPDDATGWRGAIKPILRVVGLYASNRLTAGISVNDIATEIANTRMARTSDSVEQRVDERIEEVVAEVEAPEKVPIDFGRAAEASRNRH